MQNIYEDSSNKFELCNQEEEILKFGNDMKPLYFFQKMKD